MPPRDWRLRIGDALQAIGRIERYTFGMTFDTFSNDEKTVDAVIRNIAVIGEATRNIPADVQERYPKVPWVEMRGMRNVLTHQYFGVDLSILWKTVQHDLPLLATMLPRILDEEPK